jgi:hypothetical protein
MTRPLTPVVAPYVVPIADSFASRARAYGVLFLVLDAFLALGMYKLIRFVYELRKVLEERKPPWTLIIVCAVIVVTLIAVAVWRFMQAARATKVARRAVDENLRFAFDTSKVGEVGPNGAIIPEMSIPITAEQFTHLLSMPRPQMAFQAPLPQATIKR